MRLRHFVEFAQSDVCDTFNSVVRPCYYASCMSVLKPGLYWGVSIVESQKSNEVRSIKTVTIQSFTVHSFNSNQHKNYRIFFTIFNHLIQIRQIHKNNHRMYTTSFLITSKSINQKHSCMRHFYNTWPSIHWPWPDHIAWSFTRMTDQEYSSRLTYTLLN